MGILTFLKTFFGGLFSFMTKSAENKSKKIDLQQGAVEERGDTKEIKEKLKQDKKLDREIFREPKICYEFSDSIEFRKCAEDKEHPALYFGNKEDIIIFIQRDSGNVLHRKQQKRLRKQIVNSNHLFFVVKIDPLSTHKEID